jgi:hypothetical protein
MISAIASLIAWVVSDERNRFRIALFIIALAIIIFAIVAVRLP